MQTNRREFLKAAGVAACLASLRNLPARANPSNRPNIILCMADDQGWGDMGYNGHPALKTPNFGPGSIRGDSKDAWVDGE